MPGRDDDVPPGHHLPPTRQLGERQRADIFTRHLAVARAAESPFLQSGTYEPD
ncbi:hypothetical protein ACN27F_20040 [Solwaraspora sp. WMMB335]|uniref:hypothetical protein n=1 Tax=Solwaraspora sp. WMMB335 TaxID=3404118 RepID=UPI003B947A08